MTGDALVGPGRNHEPDPLVRLATELRDLRRYVDDKSAQILRTAGLRAEPDLLRVLGSLVVEGDLSVPNGSINNDALANPIGLASNWNSASNFALPNAWTEYTACTITVPAGYTRMQFDAIGSLAAGNTLASTQYLMARITRQINGVGTVYNGVTDQTTLPAGFFGSAMTPYKWDETVVPGDVHRFALVGWVGGGAWAAGVNNYARLEVSASFTR